MNLQKFTHEALEKAKNSNNIVILTHYNPDGDAIGSSLAFQKYLKKKNIESKIIVPNDFPKFLKFLPNSKEIIIAEYKMSSTKKMIQEADCIFCLDFNTPQRINELEKVLETSKAYKILIDHHEQPSDFDLIYSDTNQPATCQMIFNIIKQNNDLNLIDNQIAECIYTGIYTDTGGFRFRSTSSETHLAVSELLKTDIKCDQIISNILDTSSLGRFQLLAKILKTIELIPEKQTAILFLKRKDMQEFGYQKGDTEGFVNYGLNIYNIQVSILLIEDLKHDFIKLSFRSKNKVDVNKFARKHFSGGGHKQASGGKSTLSLENTIQKIKDIIKNENFDYFN